VGSNLSSLRVRAPILREWREEVRRWLFPGRRERKKGGMGRGRSPLQYALEQDEMGAHQRRRRKKGKKEPEESGERVVVFSSIHHEDYVKERRKRTRRPKKKASSADTTPITPLSSTKTSASECTATVDCSFSLNTNGLNRGGGQTGDWVLPSRCFCGRIRFSANCCGVRKLPVTGW